MVEARHHRPLFEWRAAFRERGPEHMATRSVGIALSLYASMTTCRATPNQSLLAEELACADRTVRRALDRLEEDGWLTRERSAKGYTYTLTIPTDRSQSPPDTESGATGHRVRSQPVTESTGHRVHRSQSPVQPVTESGATGHRVRCIEDKRNREKPRDVPAGMPADELVAALTSVGRRPSDRERDEIVGGILETVESYGAPWPYVLLLVEDLGRRLERARPGKLAEKIVEDIAQAKWLTDPVWQERLAEQERAERLQLEAEEYDPRSDEEVLDEAGPALVAAWAEAITARAVHVNDDAVKLPGQWGYRQMSSLIADELRNGLQPPPNDEGDDR